MKHFSSISTRPLTDCAPFCMLQDEEKMACVLVKLRVAGEMLMKDISDAVTQTDPVVLLVG